jgi:citrate lyase beta subunit
MGRDDQGDLAARADEDDVGQAARGLRHHIGAPRHAGGRGIFAAIECRQSLARQCDHGRLMPQLQDMAIGLDDLVGIARSQHDQAGNGAQRDQLLHRLMGRSVLAIAHGVMGEDENGRELHER